MVVNHDQPRASSSTCKTDSVHGVNTKASPQARMPSARTPCGRMKSDDSEARMHGLLGPDLDESADSRGSWKRRRIVVNP